MTRKHFNAIAETLRAEGADDSMIRAMAAWLATFNPHFNRARFIEAAGGNP